MTEMSHSLVKNKIIAIKLRVNNNF